MQMQLPGRDHSDCHLGNSQDEEHFWRHLPVLGLRPELKSKTESNRFKETYVVAEELQLQEELL